MTASLDETLISVWRQGLGRGRENGRARKRELSGPEDKPIQAPRG